MRVLVIGGTGFIGLRVVRRLVDSGHHLTILHRGQTCFGLPPTVSEILGDRHDLPTSRSDFRSFTPDVVLDVIPYTERDAEVLVEAFRDITQRIVVLSSMDVYAAYGRLRRSEKGEPSPTPLREAAPLRSVLYPYRALAKDPSDMAYGYDKIPIEQIVMNDRRLPGTVLRLPKIYGPGDKQHHTFEYVKRMDDGRKAILLEETKAQWRWTRGYVDDVAAAIALAVTDDRAAGHIYNVGEEQAATEAEWVSSIGRAAGWIGRVVNAPRNLMPVHLLEDYDYRHHLAANTSSIRKELGYGESIRREDALRETIEWERTHPPEQVDVKRFNYAAEDVVLRTLNEDRS